MLALDPWLNIGKNRILSFNEWDRRVDDTKNKTKKS